MSETAAVAQALRDGELAVFPEEAEDVGLEIGELLATRHALGSMAVLHV